MALTCHSLASRYCLSASVARYDNGRSVAVASKSSRWRSSSSTRKAIGADMIVSSAVCDVYNVNTVVRTWRQVKLKHRLRHRQRSQDIRLERLQRHGPRALVDGTQCQCELRILPQFSAHAFLPVGPIVDAVCSQQIGQCAGKTQSAHALGALFCI